MKPPRKKRPQQERFAQPLTGIKVSGKQVPRPGPLPPLPKKT